MQATQSPLSLINRFFAVIVLLVLVTGCGETYSDNNKADFDKTIRSYIAKKKLKLERKPSGLYLEVIEKGTGKELIQSQSILKIAYKGTLLDGTVFDNTEPGKPLKSPVKGLIRGFQEALIGQTEGTKLHLIVPPQLGYGDAPLDKIPANSVLVFELEVVEVR